MLLRTYHLTKVYSNGGGVKEVNLEIAQGDFILLSGKSGAGKSTLIRLLALLDQPDKGHILLDQLNSEKMKPSEFCFWRRRLGVIPQDLRLLPERTVFSNVVLSLRAVGFSYAKSKKMALKILSRVGLSHRLWEKVENLSGGEARRTAIARALGNEPFLVLADEPLGDLDLATAEEIMRLFERINAMGTAILMVTHRRDIRPACRHREIAMEAGVINN